MKKTWNKLLTIILALFFLQTNTLAGQYKITIEVQHQNIKASLYYLGELDGKTFTPSEDFRQLNVSYEDIINDRDSRVLNQFEAQIEKESIEPQAQAKSGSDKRIIFSNTRGLYLIRYDKILINSRLITYKSSYALANSDTLISAKHESHPQEDMQSLHLVKIWKDGHSDTRPSWIYLDLYSHGEVIDTIRLAENNSWRGTLDNLDPHKTYKIVERVPEGYNSIVEYSYNTAYIYNYSKTYTGPDYIEDEDTQLPSEDDKKNPKDDHSDGNSENPTGKDDKDFGTGPKDDAQPDNKNKKDENQGPDTSEGDFNPDLIDEDTDASDKLPQTGQLWWPVGVFIALGVVFLLIYIIKRRKSEE